MLKTTTRRRGGRPRKVVQEQSVNPDGEVLAVQEPDDIIARLERKREKRKRENVGVTGTRLALNKDLLDLDRFVYRWFNDTPGRLKWKTGDDVWVFVTNDGGVKEDNADLGSVVSQIVGRNADGSALRAYLCAKPRKFWDEDQRQKHAELDAQLAELRRGNNRSGESHDYIPTSGIRIG